jgi:16S rRNA (cytosine1402-N4)-methyltransferase
MSNAQSSPQSPALQRHVPVMLPEVLAALTPNAGETYVDGTFGAGGYSTAILQAADCTVIAVDRDPDAIKAGETAVMNFKGRLKLVEGRFSELAQLAHDATDEKIMGVVLDIGVSSMQIDEAARGFSFMREGPLDMRMAQSGESAADVVNRYEADALANIIFQLGEEPRSRNIAKAIVKARIEAPLVTTLDLVRAVEAATGPQRAKDRIHPATRTFQALRIYVNSELEELAEALSGAEEILGEGGRLVVVTFHSLEDRIVKRFFASRSGSLPTASRHFPELAKGPAPSFILPQKSHIGASETEADLNPRSRSAKLRVGIRTAAPAFKRDPKDLNFPMPGRSRNQ